MKKRVVMVQLEIETDAPLSELRTKTIWSEAAALIYHYLTASERPIVRQVTATVAQMPRSTAISFGARKVKENSNAL